ncbi:MAG: cysteine--tRNA ligase [Patescibacteria group bacterium]
MKIYNTLSRKIEDLMPIKDHEILFYHCGPTVYWVQHIGNLRAMTWADFIRRSFVYLGYTVKFVRNYTDVGHLTSDEDQGEDKMEKGARREGKTPQEIADKYIKIFERDTRSLNIIEPDFKPRASEYISQMQEMIKTLIDGGYAYITDMAVVYDVSKFPGYNKLNHQKMDLNLAGAGHGTVEDPHKKHFADFNLWVFKKGAHAKALQTWPSPWGEGFPGWHIECSVMAKSLLGETIDIHMGGVEHIPVHHTNEIAQSEAANRKPFVHYWLHNEHLNVNSAKMAKSQGTGFTLKEIIDHGFSPLDLRYFFMSAHYRSKQNFTWEALKGAATALTNLREAVLDLRALSPKPVEINRENGFKNTFESYLGNDFQISQALALVWELLKSTISPGEKLALILDFDRVLGLDLDKVRDVKIPDNIRDLAEKRLVAKKSGNYAQADELREEIKRLGYEVEDLKDGYKIKNMI